MQKIFIHKMTKHTLHSFLSNKNLSNQEVHQVTTIANLSTISVIELFVALFVLSLCLFDICVGVGAFVIELSQISSFLSFYFKLDI